jgi:hypothetical protein
MRPTTHGLRQIEELLQVKPPMQLPVAGHACEQTPRRSGVVLAPSQVYGDLHSSVGRHGSPYGNGATDPPPLPPPAVPPPAGLPPPAAIPPATPLPATPPAVPASPPHRPTACSGERHLQSPEQTRLAGQLALP